MKNFTLVALTSVLLASTAAMAETPQEVLPTATDDLEQYRAWKEWTVFQNNTRGHCLATKSDGNGIIQMGLTADETKGYLGAFIKEELVQSGSENDEEATNEIVILVGDQIFTGEGSGPVEVVGDWRGGYVLANNKDFRRAIEKNDTLTVYPDRPYTVELDIKGANNAIFEIRKCTEEMTAG